jgi:hypothetical protein
MHLRVPLVARLPTSLASRFDQRQFISRVRFPDLTLSQLLARVDLQLLDIALHRVTEIGNQVVAILNLNGGGSALSSSIAYKLDRSRAITSTSGCKPSQRAKLSADRSGSRSITCDRSKSIKMVP